MDYPPKDTVMHSNLFKIQKTQLHSSNKYFFSQIRNLRSSSAYTKITVKSCRTSNSLLKNSHFTGSLFEEAHRINPAM